MRGEPVDERQAKRIVDQFFTPRQPRTTPGSPARLEVSGSDRHQQCRRTGSYTD